MTGLLPDVSENQKVTARLPARSLWYLLSLLILGPGWSRVVPGAAKPRRRRAPGVAVRAPVQVRALHVPRPTHEALASGTFLHLPQHRFRSSNVGQHRHPRGLLRVT